MKNFFWGVSTSAFQIEGHIENDFTEWEKAGKFKKNDLDPIYDNGANHWLKWKEDFDFLKILGVNAYRFSLEWARVQPELKKFSDESLDNY
jgi:beta-glucosidase